MSQKYGTNYGLIIVMFIVIVVICSLVFLADSYYETRETTLTVDNIYIDTSGDESFYMLSTTDGRVFEVDNCWVKGQNAIDTEWAYIEINETYTVQYVAWNIHNPLFDEYNTIYNFVEIDGYGDKY